MDKLISFIVLSILVVVLGLIISSVVTRLLWAWVIPDVFYGAVKQNILPDELTMWQALKLNILLYVVTYRSSSKSSKN